MKEMAGGGGRGGGGTGESEKTRGGKEKTSIVLGGGWDGRSEA